jgi:predicted methyltransferase
MTRAFRTAVLLALILLAAPAAAKQATAHGEQGREQWQKVDEVFQALGVKAGAVVADLGAGDGFFTVRLAKAVGEQGKVYAIDIGADSLRRLRARVEAAKLSQVEVVEGAADDPNVPPASLDAVLIVNAYHEMKAFKELLPKVRAALKPDGRLVIIEPIGASRRDKSRDEQTRNHEIAIEFVKQETQAAGFAQVSMQDPFTTRATDRDEMWMLVLQPASVATSAKDSWKASKDLNWEAPELRITPADFKRLIADQVLVLDVRDDEMFRAGHLPGAVLMTVEEIRTTAGLARLKAEERLIVTYCS